MGRYENGIQLLGQTIGARRETVDGWIASWRHALPSSIDPEAWEWACSQVASQYRPGDPYPVVRQVLEMAGVYGSRVQSSPASSPAGCECCNAPAYDPHHIGPGFPGRVSVLAIRVTDEPEDGVRRTRTHYLSAEDRGIEALPPHGRVLDWRVSIVTCLCVCGAGRAIRAAIQARNADPAKTGGVVPIEHDHAELTGYNPPVGSHLLAGRAADAVRQAARVAWGPTAATLGLMEAHDRWVAKNGGHRWMEGK